MSMFARHRIIDCGRLTFTLSSNASSNIYVSNHVGNLHQESDTLLAGKW